MKITTVGRQLNVPEDLKELFDRKLSKFDKFFRDDAVATITLKRRKNGRERLELTISSGGTLYRCEAEDTTFRNALDTAVGAIERQIRKNKTRLEKRLREGAFVKGSVDNYEVLDEETDFEIRTKTFTFKPMSPEEAILQMNLLEHEFFVFKNDSTGETNVVYKRIDGGYGLIMPE